MHFHLPRRHRRKLLFPPGLLALAGLLWLGCMAVQPWQEKLKLRNVIQLTLPKFRQADSPPADTPTIESHLPTIAEVQTMRPWRDAYFTGDINEDAFEQNRIAAIGHAILIDSMHSNGIRVRFSQETHYKQLVFLLNLMEKEGFRKYWVDFYHSPITFYALTDAYNPATLTIPLFSCGFVPYTPPPLPFWVRFDNQVTAFWNFEWLQALWQPEWRGSMWLLVSILLVGSWHLLQLWRVR